MSAGSGALTPGFAVAGRTRPPTLVVHFDDAGPHLDDRHRAGAPGGLSAFATSTTVNHRQHVLTTVLNHTEPLAFAAGRLYTTLSVADAAAATASSPKPNRVPSGSATSRRSPTRRWR